MNQSRRGGRTGKGQEEGYLTEWQRGKAQRFGEQTTIYVKERWVQPHKYLTHHLHCQQLNDVLKIQCVVA